MTVTNILAGLSSFHPSTFGRSVAAARGNVLEHAAWAREVDRTVGEKRDERNASLQDVVELSNAALAAQSDDAALLESTDPADPSTLADAEAAAGALKSESGATDADDASKDEGIATGGELSPEEREQVAELRRRDAEVRQHEQAHLSAAGAHARGGPTFEYETGPDGRRYAVGGEVQIDTSPEEDPAATIAKMQQVRAAASAPAEPSSQDRAIAAQASAEIQKARAEQARGKTSEGEGGEGAQGAERGEGPQGVEGYATRAQGAHGERSDRDSAVAETAGGRADKTRGGHGRGRGPADRRDPFNYDRSAPAFADSIAAGEQLDLVA